MLVAMLLGLTRVPAQDKVATPGASQAKAAAIIDRMLERNGERLRALAYYSSERTYRVEYHGTGGEHRGEIRVRAEYFGPDRKVFTVVSESGSKFICEKVLRKLVESEQEATQQTNRAQTSLGPENYTAELLGEETVATPDVPEGERAWVLRMTPKVDNKFTYRGRIWLSQKDYGVMRIVAEPAKTPSWWINRAQFDARYVRRAGVWLPAKNVSTSHVRIGGEATLTIDYGDYPEVVAKAAELRAAR
jgi:outer membrane lipoprotein-sorting protein